MKRIEIPRQKSLVLPEVKNPFVHRLHFSLLDKVKLAVMTVTVFPLRLLLIAVLLLLSWPVAFIALVGRSEEEQKLPLTGWRNSLRPVVTFLSRAVFFVGGFHWIRVIGRRCTAATAPILVVAPHSSYIDACLSTCLEMTSVVAKAETRDIPVFGTLTLFTQPVLVSREDPDSRQNTIKEIKRRAQSNGQWPQILIFPEGTTTNRTCLISFKSGAFYPGVPVQPVCIHYPNKLDTVTWTWDGPDAYKVLWLTLCQFHNYVTVEFLPVYKPSEEEVNDPKLFASNVREVMARALHIPVTDHTFDDCRLMVYAAKHNLPMSAGLVEFHKLSRKLGLTLDNMKEMLERFVHISKNGKGQITVEELASHLNLPLSDALRAMFSLYDRDSSGTIDFREYVIGLSLVSGPANNDETIQLAFQLFDTDDKGYIVESELAQILHNAFAMDELDVGVLFKEVDADCDGRITYEEFRVYAELRPEYAKLFQTYRELQAQTDISNGKRNKKIN